MLDIYSIVLLVLAFGAVLIATFTDLKTREVPDVLPIALVVLSLLVHAFHAWMLQDLWLLLIPIIVGFITFGVGYGLWLLGVWAGGDVKLFAALGVALPFTLSPFAYLINLPFIGTSTLPLFPLTLFLYSLLMGLPAALFLLLKAVFEKKELQTAIQTELVSSLPFWAALCVFSAMVSQLLIHFNREVWWLIPFVLAFAFVSKRFKLPVAGLSILVGLALGLNWATAIPLMVFSFILLVFVSFLIKTPGWCSRFVFRKKVRVSDLKVGDISAQTLIMEKGRVKEWEGPTLKAIFNKPQSVLLLPKDAKISAFRAAGLEKSDIAWLKKCVLEKKWPNQLLIKTSIPFVPLVGLGFVLSLFLGDAFFKILLG